MNLWREIVDNPLLTEYQRAMRKFFGMSGSGVSIAVLIVISVLYLLLLLIIGNFAAGIPSGAIVTLQNFILCISIPAALHGVLAGERDKRTWDILATAPLSNREIIWGKYLAAMLTQGLVFILMALPLLIVTVANKENNIGRAFKEELISLCFSIMLGAICVWFSNNSKRAFSSQLMCYAVLIVWLMVWPIIVSQVAAGNQEIFLFNPFASTFLIDGEKGALHFWGSLAFYLIIATVVLAMLPYRLKDSEVAVIRRDH